MLKGAPPVLTESKERDEDRLPLLVILVWRDYNRLGTDKRVASSFVRTTHITIQSKPFFFRSVLVFYRIFLEAITSPPYYVIVSVHNRDAGKLILDAVKYNLFNIHLIRFFMSVASMSNNICEDGVFEKESCGLKHKLNYVYVCINLFFFYC